MTGSKTNKKAMQDNDYVHSHVQLPVRSNTHNASEKSRVY